MNTQMRRAAVAVAAVAMAAVRSPPVAAPRSPATTAPRPAPRRATTSPSVCCCPRTRPRATRSSTSRSSRRRSASSRDGKAKVVYANAKQDADASRPSRSTRMITNKVDVLIVDAVDSKAIAGCVKKAKDEGIQVVAYDRLAEGPIAAYISFDNEEVGQRPGQGAARGPRRQGQGRPDRHDERRDHRPERRRCSRRARTGRARRQGEHRQGVRHQGVEAGERQRQHGARRSPPLGKDKHRGVYSANDGMAGGIITALKAAGSPAPASPARTPSSPVVQRIVAGEQS